MCSSKKCSCWDTLIHPNQPTPKSLCCSLLGRGSTVIYIRTGFIFFSIYEVSNLVKSLLTLPLNTCTGYPSYFDCFQASVCEKWPLLAAPRTAQKVSRTALASQDSYLTPFEQFWLLLAGSTSQVQSVTCKNASMKDTLDRSYGYSYSGFYL